MRPRTKELSTKSDFKSLTKCLGEIVKYKRDHVTLQVLVLIIRKFLFGHSFKTVDLNIRLYFRHLAKQTAVKNS